MSKFFKITSRTRGIPIRYSLTEITNLELLDSYLLTTFEIFKEISPNHYVILLTFQ